MLTAPPDLTITAYKFAIEVINDNTKPSTASGVTPQQYEALGEKKPCIAWLLEPLRIGNIVTKWSGTMQHPLHNSKVGVSITSFVHFAYVFSLNTIVFADLQSKPVYSPLPTPNLTPSSHSDEGSSGWSRSSKSGV